MHEACRTHEPGMYLTSTRRACDFSITEWTLHSSWASWNCLLDNHRAGGDGGGTDVHYVETLTVR